MQRAKTVGPTASEELSIQALSAGRNPDEFYFFGIMNINIPVCNIIVSA
jgi:hypothetical protein